MTVDELARAVAAGDAAAVARLLASDVVLVSDGGGRVVTPLRPVRGVTVAARLVTALGTAGAVPTVEQINGRPGVVLRRDGRARSVRLWGVLMVGEDLEAKSSEAEGQEQRRRQEEGRAPRLEGAVALHGDNQARDHGNPDDEFDDAEAQRRTVTVLRCASQNHDRRVREDRCGQRDQQSQREEHTAQLGARV